MYTSRAVFLGLPLVDWRYGTDEGEGGGRGVARGWVAVGPVAFGLLVACGGLAVGPISLGAVCVGVLGVGGIATGVFAVGGGAVGVWAVGAAAVGAVGAVGGLAVGGVFALGGTTLAEHANNASAAEHVAGNPFLRIASRGFAHRAPYLGLPVAVGLLWLWRRHARPGSRPRDSAADRDPGRDA